MTMIAWGSEDRARLKDWLGENSYRAAFLIHAVPLKQNTLERIVRGYHDPGTLLAARIRDIVERYPRGTALPHQAGLLAG